MPTPLRVLRGLLTLGALALAGCQGPGAVDGGSACLDAGLDGGFEELCGGVAPITPRFAGLAFPRQIDGGADPSLVEVVVADRDLSSACRALPDAGLPAFTAIVLRIDTQGGPLDAGAFAAPVASLVEIGYSADAGVSVLGGSSAAEVTLTRIGPRGAQGSFSGTLDALPQGLTPVSGSFDATACPGLHAALAPP